MKASFLKGNGVLPQDTRRFCQGCLNNVIPTFLQCLGAKRPSLALYNLVACCTTTKYGTALRPNSYMSLHTIINWYYAFRDQQIRSANIKAFDCFLWVRFYHLAVIRINIGSFIPFLIPFFKEKKFAVLICPHIA